MSAKFHWLTTLAAAAFVAATGAAVAAPVAREQKLDRMEALPRRLEGVDVEEKLGDTWPLHLKFKDERGQPVELRQYFDDKLPVIVTFNYSNCPMLCSLQLNGFVKSLKQLEWTAGERFRIVTISLDPAETPESAERFKQRYLKDYARPAAVEGWHFLSGDEASIRAAASALGFGYAYNEVRKEYLHASVIMLLSPDGRVMRYLYGLEHPPRTLRLSLVEASQGKVGSSMDRLLLYCFHYDETEGRYAPVARNIMRAGGGLTVLLLGTALGALWRSEKRKKRLLESTSS